MTSFSDTFDGTVYPTGYTVLAGVATQSGGKITAASGGGQLAVVRTGETYGAKQKISITIDNPNSNGMGGYIRLNLATFNGYMFLVMLGGGGVIYRLDGGVPTTIRSITGLTVASGTVYTLDPGADGNTFQLYEGATAKGLPAIDSTYPTGGVPGFTITDETTSMLAWSVDDGVTGTVYTLTAAQGSYAVAGQTTLVKRTRRVPAAQGSYAVSGQTTLLKASHRVPAVQGSYGVTGEPATLRAAHRALAVQGAYSLSGQPAALRDTRLPLVAAQGAYALAGQSAALVRGLRAVIAQGAYGLTGEPALLKSSHRLPVVQGSYGLTGEAARLLASHRAVAAQGSYGITGEDAALTYASGGRVPSFAAPFSSISPWNRRLDSYQIVRRSSTSAFSGVTNPALGKWPSTLWVGMYSATGSDPVVNLYFNPNVYTNVQTGTWARSGNNSTIEAAIMAGADQLWAGNEFNQYSSAVSGSVAAPSNYHKRTRDYWTLTPHVPSGITPPTDVDGHLAIMQPNGWMLELYSPVVLSNGDIVCFFASYTDVSGLGDGATNGRRATMLPNYGGIVRDGEFTAGVIPHALALAVGPEVLSTATPTYPAATMDRNTTGYSGPLPMGTYLSIPPTTSLASLGLTTTAGMTLAVAMQNYGGYITDQTGGGNFLILTQANESDIPGYSFNLTNDIAAIMNASQVTAVSSVADTGLYDLTGQAARLAMAHRLASAQGAYGVTGEAATLRTGRVVRAAQGAYAVAGEPASLRVARLPLVAGQGSYALTGESVALRIAHILAALQGSYALTGAAATLARGKVLQAIQGSYALTGESVTFRRALRLTLAQGSYALTGESAILIRARIIAAAQGSYSLTGEPIALRLAHRLAGGSGSYLVTGEDAGLLYSGSSPILGAAHGSYTLNGQAASLRAVRQMVAASGGYALNGQSAVLRSSHRLIAAAGSYSVTGEPVNLRMLRDLIAASGGYALTGRDAALRYRHVLTLATGLYTLTGEIAALIHHGSMTIATIGDFVDPSTPFLLLAPGSAFVLVDPVMAMTFTDPAFPFVLTAPTDGL